MLEKLIPPDWNYHLVANMLTEIIIKDVIGRLNIGIWMLIIYLQKHIWVGQPYNINGIYKL